MKRVNKFLLITAAGLIASCGGPADKVTGAKSLTEEIAGSYARESTITGNSSYDGQPYTSELRDTIILIQKENGFEVQDRHWKRTTDKNGKSNDPAGLRGNGDTFQGSFNKIDTTISNPLGGSIKINLGKHQLFPVDHPNLIFTKVK